MFEQSRRFRTDAQAVPGATKSQAQITGRPSDGVSIHLDWLSCTFPASVSVDWLIEQFFGVSKSHFVRHDHFQYGYSTRYQWGHVNILCDGPEEKGVHVDISGQGIRQVEQMVFSGDSAGWSRFISDCFAAGADFTRLDVASDIVGSDESMPFTFEQVMEHLNGGHYRSWFRNFQPQYKYTKRDGLPVCVGRSVYFGSKLSRVFAVLYDKRLERLSAGDDVDVENWLRLEFRFKHERANSLALLVAEGRALGEWFAGVIAEYINFLDPADDGAGNVSRRAVASWWSAFLGGVAKIKLTAQRVTRTLEDKLRWLEKQVSISLGQLREFHRLTSGSVGFWDYFRNLVSIGESRMRDLHVEQVQSWVAITNIA